MDILSITKRQPLNPDDVLYMNGEELIINSIKGTGTSSIVYEATLDGRKIILKELYPNGLGIFRGKDNSLIIPKGKENEFQSYKEGLNRAYQTQLSFHNNHKIRNLTVEPQKLYKHNNTLYVVMHLANGTSYDLIEPESMLSILEVGKSLSEAIQSYHEKGYLNLDIKPGNIFIFPETNQLVQLFDFNTVCTKEEASQGKFSYSDGYAAPEVKAAKKGGGKFSEVGEQADIYSIGAVIFEKIMGRLPKIADQRKGKRWNFEGNPYLKEAVPQLQKGITELFRKTLAIDKKDRYSSAKELISDLKKLINLAGIKVFLKNQRISPCTPKNIYISRKDILPKISKALNETHILYLHALGGSGKSETAREYAEQYAYKYDFIQSVFYSGSLQKTIANLDFAGLKDEDRFAHSDEDIDRLYKYKYGLLGNSDIYKANTLLIIDNYDYNADPTSEEYQQNYNIVRNLKKLNIHILFTTRVKPEDNTECLDLENMSEEELQALFFRINPKDKNDPERMELVKEIIEVSYKHTMTVKLVAMQSAKYLKPLSKYLDILKTSGLNSGIKGRLTNEKDDESITMSTVYDHIKALFDFESLNDKQRYIMVNACLLPLSGLEASTFSEYIDLEHFDGASDGDCIDESIEDLVNSGWIEYADTSEKRFTAETKITLHPLICDIVTNELKPELTDNKCRKFYISFLDLIQEWGNKKANGDDDIHLENMVYDLFPSIYTIFQNGRILRAINYICLSYSKISYIENHLIIFSNYYKYLFYFGDEKKLTIPGGITKIGSESFMNCDFLTEIHIPNRVTEIGDSAFEGCSSLIEIIIPDSVTSIGQRAFYSCSSLEKINIPNTITKIKSSTFSYCCSLINITIPDSVKTIEYHAFFDCKSLSKITLPNSVTEIGYNAFQACISLTEVKLSDNITKIKNRTFYDCLSLNKIIISDNIIEIGDEAFAFCQSLKKLNIPDSVTEIGFAAFGGCHSLTDINIPGGIKYIRHDIFNGCNSLKNIKIPNSVTHIEGWAFSGCSSLNNVIIPDSVTHIGERAFEECYSLSNISIPDSVIYVGAWAFIGCPLSIPNKLLEIESKAINRIYSKGHEQWYLEYLTVSDNNTEIEDFAFEEYLRLTEADIPYGILKIGNSAFKKCTSLKKVKIPDSVTEIGNSAFEDCSSLTNIIIPNSVIKIGLMAFSGCSSLSEITISDNIQTIEFCTFAYCKSLTKITIPDSVTEIGKAAFADCHSLKEISLPESIIQIGEMGFENCYSLENITFPKNIKQIGDYAFWGCSSLKTIVIPKRVTSFSKGIFDYTMLEKITLLNPFIDISESNIGYYDSYDPINEKFSHNIQKNETFILEGYKGSTADQYAKLHGFKFIPLD